MPSLEATDKIEPLKQSEPPIDGLAIHAQSRTEMGQVEQLASADGRMVNQVRKAVELVDGEDVRDVPFRERAGVGSQPTQASCGIRAGECLRESP